MEKAMENLRKNMQDKTVLQTTSADLNGENWCWHAVAFLFPVFFWFLKRSHFKSIVPQSHDMLVTEENVLFLSSL